MWAELMPTGYMSPKSRQGSLRSQLLDWSTPSLRPNQLHLGVKEKEQCRAWWAWKGGICGGAPGRAVQGAQSCKRTTAHSQWGSRHSIDAHWGRSFWVQSSTTHLGLLTCSRPLRRVLCPAIAPCSEKRALPLPITSPPGPALNPGVMHSYALPSTAMYSHALPRYGLSLPQALPFKTSRHAFSPSPQKGEMKILMASFQKYEYE